MRWPWQPDPAKVALQRRLESVLEDALREHDVAVEVLERKVNERVASRARR